MKAISSRPKTCKNKECRAKFVPERPFQKACGIPCSIVVGKEDLAKKRAKQEREQKLQEKVERQQHREAKARIKTRAEHLSDTQAVINRYVRLRDARLGCVSCDKPSAWDGQWHASHFRSVGAAKHLRFNLWNIHKACSVCNNHLSGNIAGYRPALIKKIGAGRVDWLESASWVAKHDIDYLKRLKKVFSKKCRRLQARLS